MMPNRNDRWYAESGEYEYFAVFVIDRQRNIIAYPNGMKYKHLKNKGDTIIKKNNFIDNPVDANSNLWRDLFPKMVRLPQNVPVSR